METVNPHTETEITALSTDGRGITRVDGQSVFIKQALPGDRVRIAVDFSTKPPSGRLIEILAESPFRVFHPCPYADKCPGSIWGSLTYSEQLRHKQILTERTLRKTAGQIEILPTVASPKQWQYRNRVSLNVQQIDGSLQVGYKAAPRGSHIIPVTTCRLASQSIDHCIGRLSELFRNIDCPDTVPIRLLLFETSDRPGCLLIFSGRVSGSARKKWIGFLKPLTDLLHFGFASGNRQGLLMDALDFNLSAESPRMFTHFKDHRIELSPTAFCQVNESAANLVLNRVEKYSSSHSFRHVWDLYGGYGPLGFAAAGSGTPLTILDHTPGAAQAAQELADQIGNNTVEYIAGDLLASMRDIRDGITSSDLVILDPPRSGVHPETLAMLAASPIRHVIYLSCNPARLGRDLRMLMKARFQPAEVQPYDFFPQTPAIEVLSILTRS